jgi:lysophospholipase L1-like esterase
MKPITINCFGDSVTEGMTMDGHHTADYGKKPFPAQLYTMLRDEGYDVQVVNSGHGGEDVSAIAARTGGIACYVSEELAVPADTWVSLGKRRRTDGRNYDTALRLYDADEAGEDYCVYFTQMSRDTNPVHIDGVPYQMKTEDETNFIRRMDTDGGTISIPRGAEVFTANNRNADVNIFYAGINDGKSLTLQRFIKAMKASAAVNGGRYILLGATHAIWNNWSDVQGSPEEKYQIYRRTCMEAFGVHFIDLYDEFARHGLDIALERGYFADIPAERLDEMRALLCAHTIPAEFSYNKESQGNVHLSEEGYYVMACLIEERMKRLGYLH